jgi:site-specific recombinase XerD
LSPPSSFSIPPSFSPPSSPYDFPRPPSLPEKFSENWLSKLDDELRSRKYSLQTRRAYIYYNKLICRTLQKTPEEIHSNDVTEFLANMEKTGKYSASAMNLAISAIKFFFVNILNKDDITDRHRPRRDGRLPVILSKEEVAKILSLEKNPKHRLLLMLTYSSGLRVSEVVALKKEHIDLSRKVIYVRLGKGRKDRSTLLSEKAVSFLEEYYDFFGIEKWLFPGQPPTRSLSIRSAQNIFTKAVRRAGLLKEISIHSLRHTFATHLLESGTDIRYIQTLLGHASLRTTERYTHVARRSVLSIKSPLDTLTL